MFRILVVEDDMDLQQVFCKSLQNGGYQAFGTATGMEALALLEKEYIDLVITDIMLPGMSGYDLITQLHKIYPQMPVLIISARGDIWDKQCGFTAGADDYMVKPVNLSEMLMRVGAILRRSKSVQERKLSYGNTVLEYDSWTVTDEQGSQILPQKEFQLLYKLLSYSGQIFTRQQILDEIWGIDGTVDSHTLDVHISRLRERFKNNNDFEIVTIRGLGYKAVKHEK